MIFEYFQKRFGISKEVFDNYLIYLGQKEKIYIGPKKIIEKPEPVSVGILIAREDGAVKPTSNFLQLFGHLATKNIIQVDRQSAIKYIEGYDLTTDLVIEDGYVVISYEGTPLGCAFKKEKNLINNLPKAKRQKVKYI